MFFFNIFEKIRAQCTGHKAQGTRHRAQGTGHKAQGTRHRAQGTGHKAQGARHRAQGAGHKAQGARRKAEGAGVKAQGARRMERESIPSSLHLAPCPFSMAFSINDTTNSYIVNVILRAIGGGCKRCLKVE